MLPTPIEEQDIVNEMQFRKRSGIRIDELFAAQRNKAFIVLGVTVIEKGRLGTNASVCVSTFDKIQNVLRDCID